MKNKELLLLIAVILSIGCAINIILFLIGHRISSLGIAAALSVGMAAFAALGVRK